MKTFRDLIRFWGGARPLAEDLGRRYWTVEGWRRHNSIPAKEWALLLEKAAEHGYPIDADLLVSLVKQGR